MSKNNYFEKVKAPLESESTELKYQLQIYVPSTDFEKATTSPIYNKRIKETETFMSERFGGDTSVRAKGGYIFEDGTNKGTLASENVAIVEASMTRKQYEENKGEIETYIKDKKTEWNQESIGYKFEDDFYIYPKFD